MLRLLMLVILVGAIAGSSFYLVTDYQNDTGANGSIGLYAEFFTLEELIRHSSLIVVAELVETREEKVEEIHPVTGPTGWYYDDVIRTYKAQEVITGTIEDGEEFEVWDSYGFIAPRGQESIEYEVLPLSLGEVYVLFLTQVSRNDELFWGKVGDPELAELSGDQLRFLATERYQKAVREHGFELVGNSQAPFAPTLPELRDLVRAIEEAGPLPSPTPAPEPTPAKVVPEN